MATLALSRDLLTDYVKLEKRVQSKVLELADIFQRSTAQMLRDSKGTHLERYSQGRDKRARTIRIDDNHRGVVLDVGDDETFVLTRVGTHDTVDRWMAQNTFRVNEATGALEVRNVVAIEEQLAAAPPPAAPGATPLYAHRKDKDFGALGIEAELVRVLRLFTDEDQLQALLGVLPQTQADALILLTGPEPVEELYREVAGDLVPEKIDPEDFAAALEAPASRSQFHVVGDDNELAEMLARPMAQWRTYLHHTQRSVAERPVYNGPVRVTGGPGTGKTVVALHRAKTLADALEDRTGKPILFTTFTRNLAQAIEGELRLLGGTELLDVVEVLNVDRLSYRVVQEAEDVRPVFADDEAVLKQWHDVVDESGLELTAEFLRAEWEQVILAQGCTSRSEYFNASRAGRGIRLDRRARAEVWKAVEVFSQRLVDSNRRTHLQLASAASAYLAERTVKPYRHVLVDEAQDLHEAQWRLLRAAVAEGPNDLFIVGDSHQRIYDRRSSLSKVGINVRGRSKRLRINYRTTHEILGWSMALLGEADYDDLDTGLESDDFAGYHSFLHGPRPTMSGHASKKEQLAALVAQVDAWVTNGVEENDIVVTARSSSSFGAVITALRQAGIATVELGRELTAGDGVRIGTMHRLKGLEFRCVAVVDADDDAIPAHWELTPAHADEVQHQADLQRERCLLYVACTRARDDLWVSWSGKPSRFLFSVSGGGLRYLN